MLPNMPDSHYAVKRLNAREAVAGLRVFAEDAAMLSLKKIRRSKGLSQTQLADMVGCDQGYIAKIEKGTANPTLSMIEDIARALKVSPAALFEVGELQARIQAAIHSLPEEQQGAALVVLEAMARQTNNTR